MSKQYSDYNSSQTSMLNNSIQYNGRVNTLELSEDPDARFKMFEKIAIKNKATEYREPLKNDFEENALSQAFFCKENVQIVFIDIMFCQLGQENSVCPRTFFSKKQWFINELIWFN